MGRKILIADDEIIVLSILKRKLEEKGYTVLAAPTAKDCLEMAVKELPDLIILDIVMPDMNGYQVAQALRDNPVTKATQILFTTGQDLEPAAVLNRCKELEAVDFLFKPFTIDDLEKKVGEILK